MILTKGVTKFLKWALLSAFALVILFCHSFLLSAAVSNEHDNSSHIHVHTVLVSNRSVIDTVVLDIIPLATNVVLAFLFVFIATTVDAARFRDIIKKFLSIRLSLRMLTAFSEGILHPKKFDFAV